ncbi:MAG: DoxX family membrane protein [Pseudomonadales bacterium]|nr:DoxX family membrane protein [Pseudomonadales bacterium]
MPLYVCNARNGALDSSAKSRIAEAITNIHCKITGAPPSFVHTVFFEEAPQFPLEGKALYVRGTIRKGRSDDQKKQIRELIRDSLVEYGGVTSLVTEAEIRETPAGWVLEGGRSCQSRVKRLIGLRPKNSVALRRNKMLADEQLPNHPSLTLTARGLFTGLFFLSGVTHFTNIPYYIGLMPESFPFPAFWVILSGVVELAGASMILFNWRPRLGGWLLIIFLIPVTIVVHGYEMLHAEDQAMRAIQQASFIKGFALIGTALFFTQVGVTPKRPAPSV